MRFGIVVAGLVAWAGESLAAQESDTTRLQDIVVTATRSPVPLSRIGSSVGRLDGDDVRRHQLTTLREALQLLPGGPVLGSGGFGAVASLFLRGAGSGHSLLLLDGIRMNDANVGSGILLGGAELSGLGSIELVRGPQSVLYGGAALGGVIALDAAPARPEPWGEAELDAGSWESWRGRLSGGGGTSRLGITANLSANGTRNDRRPNDWRQRTQLVRIDYRVSSAVRAGATLRGWQQEYTSPGDLRTANTTPVGRTDYRAHLGTVWIETSPAGSWRTRLLAGLAGQRLEDSSSYDGSPFLFEQRHTRWVIDWQNTASLGPVALLGGVNREWSSVETRDEDRLRERLWGLFGEARLEMDPIALTAGARSDDYNTFGQATTFRLTAAWRIERTRTKLRGSLGTGFMPPSLAGRFGDAFLAANPGIRPERSRGWDAGLDQALGTWGTLGVSWFSNSLTDLIAFEGAPFPEKGRLVNLERARTSGLEASGRIAAGPADAFIAYTFLKARNLSEPDPAAVRLIRRPRHTVSADLSLAVDGRTGLGAGILAMFDRVDSDFNQFPAARVDPGDFAILRFYGSRDIGSRFIVQLRVENALDTSYEPVYGFPAPGRSVLGSVSVRL